MIEIIEHCQVEWDKQRGVLYIHNKDTGATIVRICKLPSREDNIGLAEGQIDIAVNPNAVIMPDQDDLREY